jgi:hypothetical protein
MRSACSTPHSRPVKPRSWTGSCERRHSASLASAPITSTSITRDQYSELAKKALTSSPIGRFWINGTLTSPIKRQVSSRAIEFAKTGTLRVAYDIRHLAFQDVGLRTGAIELALALTKIPQIELSFLVNTRNEADGLGRAITVEEWRDEFAVIHKPAPFLNRRELEIPFSSSSHVVVTYQGSIAHDVSMAMGDDANFDACGTTCALSLLCASGIVAHSAGSRKELASELGIPAEEIVVAPLESTAQATFQVYRSAVLRPTERSLQMRRLMREAILSWSRPLSGRSPLRDGDLARVADQAMGVRTAWKSLGAAVGRRVGREARRFHSRHVRSKA